MKNQNKTIISTAIISGVILVIAITALIMFKPVNSNQSITVQGIAEVKAMPDLIVVYYNIETKGDNLSQAKEENIEIYNKLLSELVIGGFDPKDLLTESFNVYPDYIWDEGIRKDNGYKATHYLKINIPSEELDKLDIAIDSAVISNTSINYINFELTQESQNKYKSEAIKLASKDAQVKAKSLAEGFDKDLGKLVNVYVDNFGYSPWNAYSSVGMDSKEEVVRSISMAKINPSEKAISASVSATFKLK